jgi:DNA-binding response OmpR family regulator
MYAPTHYEQIDSLLEKEGCPISFLSGPAEALDVVSRSAPISTLGFVAVFPREKAQVAEFLTRHPCVSLIIQEPTDRSGTERRVWVFAGVVNRLMSQISIQMLAAHIESLFHEERHPLSKAQVFRSRDRRIIADSRWPFIRLDGRKVELSASEWEIFYLLAESPNRVWTRAELLSAMRRRGRGRRCSDERVVDVHIKNLRRKIEDSPHRPRWIRTARGRGYYLTGFLPPRPAADSTHPMLHGAPAAAGAP